MFLDDWESLGRIVLVAAGAYAALVLILRVAGKRSLAKLNAFDFAVTVAFGSMLATAILSADVTLAEGIVALAALAALQFAVSKTSIHAPPFERLVRSEPRLVVEDGRFLNDAMARERLTESEVEQAIRKQGIGRIEEVAAVVLETDGSFSVIRAGGDGPLSALRSVNRQSRRS